MKIEISIKKALWLATILACTASVQPVIAAYKNPSSYKSPKKTITLGGNGKYSTSKWNDTGAFNNAIKDVHAAGGGRVIVPGGSYVAKGIVLKDNVHLLINKNAKIRLPNAGGGLFSGGTLRNASIRGTGGNFRAELRGPVSAGSKLIHGWSLDNVMLQNITIINNTPTEFAAIQLDWRPKDKTAAGRKQHPNNVTLQNIHKTTRSHIGYGIMQAQAARNTHFINMRGKGGVPVRLETGWVTMQLYGRNTGGVHSVKVQNCVSTEAAATVKINPHSMINGNVTVLNCSATASGTVVSFEPGSAHKKQLKDAGLGSGSFGRVEIKNTTAYYRPTGSPHKYGFFSIMPEKFVSNYPNHNLFYKTPSGSKAKNYDNDYIGPSLAVVLQMGKARNGVKRTGTKRVVASKYGNVNNHFRTLITKFSSQAAWMYRNIPTKSTPPGW